MWNDGGEGDLSFLIKQNGLYYSILPEFYDNVTGTYTPIETSDFSKGFVVSELFTVIEIDMIQFKPIDKFDNFILVSEENIKLYTLGIKSNSELIVTNGDIPFHIAATTNSFSPTFNISLGCLIKSLLISDI